MELPLTVPEDRLQADWPATRAEGLRRIAAFQPRMGRHYASQRNYDRGPEDRGNVSVLSPYLRRRLVTEEEVLTATLARHSIGSAEKFVSEVFWRGYFKGWLEWRPTVWSAYREGVVSDRRALDSTTARRLREAEEGRTGIDCLDAWAVELVETGYLHNHARMWFASIWIFTLGLPWRLGADFFLRHLLDGDAASNTLGWRWVAGLHTVGKNYSARASNIGKYTDGRFSPGPLAGDPEPLSDGGLPPRGSLRQPAAPDFAEPTALLITEEDLAPQSLGLPLDRAVAVATLRLTTRRSPEPVSEAVAKFDADALADAATRAEEAGLPTPARLDHPDPAALVAWAKDSGATRIATAFFPVGWVCDWLHQARPELARAGVIVEEMQRPWDSAVFPHATAGFFKVRKAIPELLREHGLL
ncbi:MAG: FAD-binding domain-containing protein [Pseudomonadota bacterium]